MTKKTGGPASEKTLRDYFAAHAPEAPDWYMNEMLSAPRICSECEAYYKWRWEYADQMLKERTRHANNNT